jgi:hypothetical protein
MNRRARLAGIPAAMSATIISVRLIARSTQRAQRLADVAPARIDE